MSSENPNMKLRMPGKDYTDPGYYFCTLVVEGRRQLFGTVVDFPDAKHLDHNTQSTSPAHSTQVSQAPATTNQTVALSSQAPIECCGKNVSRSSSLTFPYGHGKPYKGACVAYSPYGKMIAEELENIGAKGQYRNMVELKGKTILPDHIHILIHIKERIPRPLGFVINGFIVGCRRRWKELCGIALIKNEPQWIFQDCKEEVRTGKWQLPKDQIAYPMPQQDGALRIFENGYNDNIVSKTGQLDSYYRYMEENPWRWLMKEKHPQLFSKTWAKELLPGHRFDLIGNMFLLYRPWKVAVRISRFAVEEEAFNPYKPEECFYDIQGTKILRQATYSFPRRDKTAEEVQVAIEPYLKLARKGAVLVTPCISPAEQQVVQAAYNEGLPVVMMSFYGFNRYYHPTKAHYDACSRGILLQLAPWRYDPSRKMTKVLCEELNMLAFRFTGI